MNLRRAMTESAKPLAALRIAVCLIVLVSPELRRAAQFASEPALLDALPEGLGLLSHLPLPASWVRALEMVATSSAASGLLGYHSRASLLVLTVSGGLVFSFSQRSGAVLHDMHLFWLTALLGVSRCGDVWSLDSWGKKSPPASLHYGVPAAFARALLGLIYLFPGLHKLEQSGLAWLSGENMIRHLHAKWFEFAEHPLLRVDRSPLSCELGAWAVVGFELSFFWLAQLRRTRVLALVLALGFHLATDAFLFIRFVSLAGCLVILLPLGRASSNAPVSSEAWPRAVVFVGSALLLAVMVQGVRGKTQAWPFACYPTFAYLASPTHVDLRFEVRHDNGQVQSFTGRERSPRTQTEWGRVLHLANSPPERVRDALYDFARRQAERANVRLEPGDSLSVERAEYATQPEAWGRSPVRTTRLAELPITRAAATAPR